MTKLFCTTQRLALLLERDQPRQYLSGERFWYDRHAERMGKGEPRSPWRSGLKRASLVSYLCTAGPLKRLAVVCSGGLGKSTNLEWLEYKIAARDARQVPFRFKLGEDDLPRDLREFWNETLPGKIREAPGNGDLAHERLMAELTRLRTQGRLSFLFDSIDQAVPDALALLRKLLKTSDWNQCPVVVSSRPEALYHGWKSLIVPDERSWRFVRIEPLHRNSQKRGLLEQDGVKRFHLLPPGGKALMANPRHIEYVTKLPVSPRTTRRREPTELDQFELRDLHTASHVLAGAARYMIWKGMESPAARLLGRPKDRPIPEEASARQIEFTLDLLGALAYAMYTMPAPGSSSPKRFRPNVARVPAGGKRREKFDGRVVSLIQSTSPTWRDYAVADLEDDLRSLAALNSFIDCSLLDTALLGAIRWHDRSLQEFFAAWWLSRYANAEDIARLRQWRYDDTRDDEAAALYRPLWGFLVEMPKAAREDRIWARGVGVLFEPKGARCCEMIYRSWPALKRSPSGRKILAGWRDEFRQLLDSPGATGEVARQIFAGFRRCPRDRSEDGKPFSMGSPDDEKDRHADELIHNVIITPFAMHEFPVTNEQFELFDPLHREERPWQESNEHPAVSVTWFQAWCFTRWLGTQGISGRPHKIRLPTEAEWEYACRAGTKTRYNFGDSIDGTLCNIGRQVGRTTPRGKYSANGWQLYDMHGNVWEWCADWYSAKYYERLLAQSPAQNPRGPREASARVLRGGGWFNIGGRCRSAYRDGFGPGGRSHYCGFRLAAVPVGAKPGKPSRA